MKKNPSKYTDYQLQVIIVMHGAQKTKVLWCVGIVDMKGEQCYTKDSKS